VCRNLDSHNVGCSPTNLSFNGVILDNFLCYASGCAARRGHVPRDGMRASFGTCMGDLALIALF
jgi:hypothetical protein